MPCFRGRAPAPAASRQRQPAPTSSAQPTRPIRADRPRQPVREGAAAARSRARQAARADRSFRRAPARPAPHARCRRPVPADAAARRSRADPSRCRRFQLRRHHAAAARPTRSRDDEPPSRSATRSIVEGMDEIGLEGRFREPLGARRCRRRGGQRRQVQARAEGGQAARRPPAPLRRLL